MWDRHKLLSQCEVEARQLAPQNVSEMTPSRRDFAQYVTTQRRGLATVAHLSSGPRQAAVDLAQACDDAEVAGLSIVADLSMQDLAAIVAAASAPVVRQAFVVEPNQLYAARLHGADATVLPTRELGDAALRELAAIAGSLHMAVIAEVFDDAGLAVALQLPRVLIGIGCAGDSGDIDVSATKALAKQVPVARTILALPPLADVRLADGLRGVVDAVQLSSLAIDDDIATMVADLARE